MPRVFVALMLGPELGPSIQALARDALAGGERGLRLARGEGLHLTLVFLGDVEEGSLAAIEDALARALAGVRRPALVLDRAGAFPGPGRERVLWVGVREAEGAAGRLDDLFSRVVAGLGEAGCAPPEAAGHPFRPHVTLARVRPGRTRVPAGFYDLAPDLPWLPAEASLVESVRRGPGPPVYEPRRGFPLDP